MAESINWFVIKQQVIYFPEVLVRESRLILGMVRVRTAHQEYCTSGSTLSN